MACPAKKGLLRRAVRRPGLPVAQGSACRHGRAKPVTPGPLVPALPSCCRHCPQAEHVTKHEEGTLSYQLSWGDEDPDSLIIFERYVSKDYLENVGVERERKTHGKSEHLDMQRERDVLMYYDMHTFLMTMSFLATKSVLPVYPLAAAAKSSSSHSPPAQVHWQSAPFKQFREDLAAAGVEWESKVVTKYWETGPGYMARA